MCINWGKRRRYAKIEVVEKLSQNYPSFIPKLCTGFFSYKWLLCKSLVGYPPIFLGLLLLLVRYIQGFKSNATYKYIAG